MFGHYVSLSEKKTQGGRWGGRRTHKIQGCDPEYGAHVHTGLQLKRLQGAFEVFVDSSGPF